MPGARLPGAEGSTPPRLLRGGGGGGCGDPPAHPASRPRGVKAEREGSGPAFEVTPAVWGNAGISPFSNKITRSRGDGEALKAWQCYGT